MIIGVSESLAVSRPVVNASHASCFAPHASPSTGGATRRPANLNSIFGRPASGDTRATPAQVSTLYNAFRRVRSRRARRKRAPRVLLHTGRVPSTRIPASGDSLMRIMRARPASFDLIFWESRERGHSAPPEILEVPRAACASEAADIFIEGYACSPRAARCGDYRRRRAPWSRALILGAPSKFVESHALNWIKPRGLEHRR
ncbi:hypothetical protein FB451DRAFT_1397575 [Mycena latifolia]|nr:hypothetical protein FB451DRAFT_1397571 [Mycena latifolia]KAJ7476247.1 hypothetical protein FB451DRAFT_1397575 [Mycena latifolia]